MKRLMMLLMLWTGLIIAVYIVDAAKLSRNAPTTLHGRQQHHL